MCSCETEEHENYITTINEPFLFDFLSLHSKTKRPFVFKFFSFGFQGSPAKCWLRMFVWDSTSNSRYRDGGKTYYKQLADMNSNMIFIVRSDTCYNIFGSYSKNCLITRPSYKRSFSTTELQLGSFCLPLDYSSHVITKHVIMCLLCDALV